MKSYGRSQPTACRQIEARPDHTEDHGNYCQENYTPSFNRLAIRPDQQRRPTLLLDGKWKELVDIVPHRRLVDWKGMSLPVLSVENEYRADTIMGRAEKAAVLKQWLEHRDRKG